MEWVGGLVVSFSESSSELGKVGDGKSKNK